MKFEQIVCVDRTGLTPQGYRQLQIFSDHPITCYADYPASDEEIIARIRDADCVLVSWNTPISAAALQAARRLRYVGMCCSLYDPASANVDILAAQQQGISVRGVRDYGDEGVVEFIFAQLIALYKGLGKTQWGAEPTELKGKCLGVIGLGATGQRVAKAGQAFGMQVLYTSRTRKPALENAALQYAALPELLQQADVVTTHLPRRTCLLGAAEFALLKPGAVLVNTSLGPTFDQAAFLDWISAGQNYAIIDADGAENMAAALRTAPWVILSDKVAGWTVEARARLTEKVLQNIRDFLRIVN